MNTTGAIIRSIRTSKGLSQEYIANELELKQAAYSNIENNKTDITLSKLNKIAKLLEVSIYDLIPTDNSEYHVSEPNLFAPGRASKGYELSLTIKLNDPSKESEILRMLGLK